MVAKKTMALDFVQLFQSNEKLLLRAPVFICLVHSIIGSSLSGQCGLCILDLKERLMSNARLESLYLTPSKLRWPK